MDDLLATAPAAGSVHHGLGALDAKRRRARGLEISDETAREERTALLFPAIAASILVRVRKACDGPLLLFKGPEIAARYLSGGRAFGDIDLLTPSPEATQRSLLAAGFVPTGSAAPHHLKPLVWESLPIRVEIHDSVKWPKRRPSPTIDEILEASVPTATGVEGFQAPSDPYHAILVAGHAWEHVPLRLARDLLDIAVLTNAVDDDELLQLAASWHIRKIWTTTYDAVRAVFFERHRTVPMLTWARHLAAMRDRTVLEAHLEHWLSPFWDEPPGPALVSTARVLRDELSPRPDETWRDKLGRSRTAVRHALLPFKMHEARVDGSSKPPFGSSDDST